MMRLNSYRFDADTLLKTIRVKTETPGAKEGARALRDLKKAAVEASTSDTGTSRGISVDLKNLDNGIKKIQQMKSLVLALKKTDVDFSKLKNSLDAKNLTNSLPSGTKGILSDFVNVQSPMKNARWGNNRFQKDMELLNGLENAFRSVHDELVKLDPELAKTDNDLNKIGNTAEDSGKKIKGNANDVKSLKDIFSKLSSGNIIGSVQKAFEALDITRLTYLFRAVKRGTQFMTDAVETAAEYQEALNLYKMALGEYADEATEWMEEISDKLMLDPSQMMQYTGGFYNLTKGMGVASDAAFIMSQNLTQLSYDMASYLNISNEAAQAKIQSAMTGQSRAVANAGVAMQVASLQELALSMGIKKNVSEMTQAEKTYLRYIQLLKSTTHMQGDLARTIITPANAIRILKQQLNLLARSFGEVFVPIVMKAIPVLMAFSMALQEVLKDLAALLGFKLAEVDFSIKADFNFEDIEEGLNALNNNAKKTAASINRTLAPFDELNVVESLSGGKGIGGAGDTFDFSIFDKYIDRYDMLAGYTDELKKKAESLVRPMKAVLGVMVGITGALKIKEILDFFTKADSLGGKLVGKLTTFYGSLGKVGTVLSKIFGVVSGIFLMFNGLSNMESVIEKFARGEISSGLANILSTLSAMETTLGGVITGFQIAGPLGGIVFGALSGITAIIDGLTTSKKVAEELAIEAKVTKAIFGDLDISTNQWLDTLKAVPTSFDTVMVSVEKFNSQLSTLIGTFNSAWQDTNLLVIQFDAFNDTSDPKAFKQNVKGIKDSVKTTVNDSIKVIDTGLDKSLILIADLYKNTKDKTDEGYQDMIKAAKTYANDQKNTITTAQNKITSIYDKALKERRDLTDTERNIIDTQLETIRVHTEKSFSESKTTIDYYTSQIGKSALSISEESFKNLVEARKTYQTDETKNIDTWYNEQYNNLCRIYGGEENLLKNHNGELEILNARRVDKEKEVDDTLRKNKNILVSNLVKAYNELEGKTDKTSLATKEKIENMLTDLDVDTSELEGASDDLKKALTDKKNNNSVVSQLTTSMKEAAPSIGEALAKGLIKGLENALSKTKISFEQGLIDTAIKAGKSSLGLLNIMKIVTPFAEGGYPTSGDLFFANENGRAEFITSVGNKTAVANQDQMVQALTNAIVSGFNSLNTNSGGAQNLTVQIGNEKVYSGQIAYQNRQADRYGTTSTVKV